MMGESQGEKKDKVHVVVRVRPLIERELRDEEAIAAKQSWKLEPTAISNKDCNYRFDKVYGEDSSTEEIYKDVVAPMVQAAFKGFNGTILCYGQTSSGKTHTLYGSDKDPGIIGYFAEHVSRYLQTQTQKEGIDHDLEDTENSQSYVIELNLIEIYNEVVKDLLDSENTIDLIEKDGAVVPKSVKNIKVMRPDDIRASAERLQRERKLGETRMNKSSSRSHTILRVKITSLEKPAGDEESTSAVGVGILNFVDLAGSEKASQTGAVGDRFKEAVHINTSLSALSRVVMQLSAAQKVNVRESASLTTPSCNSLATKQPKSRMPPHISYRDSKLTRLLQSSLGGNAHVAIVCNVTPASIEETKSTLMFANSAKSIQIKPTRTYVTIATDATAYQRYIEELQTELSGKDKEVSQLKKQLEAMEQLDRKTRNTDAALFDADEMRRKTFHAALPHRRARASEGFVDGKKFASMELSSSIWSEHPQQQFKDFLVRKGPDRPDTMSSESSVVIKKIDQECQTSADLNPSPAKRPRLDHNASGTPVSTLRMQRSLLSQAIEEDRSSWEDEKLFLENELVELKKENILINEKLSKIQTLELVGTELQEKLKESTSESRKEIEILKRQHAQAIQDLKSAKEFEVDTLSAQITKRDTLVKEMKQQLEEMKNDLAKQAEECNSDPGCKSSMIINESFDIGSITNELMALKETIEEQEQLKIRREQKIAVLQSQILELKEENLSHCELQERLSAIQGEKEELSQQVAHCKSNCALQIAEVKSSSMAELMGLKETIEEQAQLKLEMEEKLAALQIKISELNEEISSYCGLQDNMKERLSAVEGEKEVLSQQVAQCKSNCAQQIAEVKSSSVAELMALKETIEGQAQLKLQREEEIAALQIKISELNAEISSNCGLQDNMKERLSAIQAENEELSQHVAQCKSNCALQIAEVKNSSLSELMALKETIEEQAQLQLEREEKITAFQIKVLELNEEISSYCGLQDSMKEKLSAIQAENEELSQQVAECKLNCAQQIAEVKSSSVAELMALKESIEEQTQLKLEREEKITALQTQILELKEENVSFCELQGQMKERLSAIQAENEELSRQFTECKSNCALQIADVKGSNGAELRTNELIASTETIEQQEQLKLQREEQIAALQSQILVLKEESLRYCGLQDNMKERLSAIQGENEELSRQVTECKSKCALEIAQVKSSSVAELMALKETIVEEHEQLKLQREERIAALQSQILELKEENLSYCGLQDQMKEKLSAIQVENEELSRQVAECKSNCALQIAEVKSSSVAELIALKETIEEQAQLKLQREEKLAALESQILELKEENVSYCGLQDQMKERLSAIQVENDELSRQVAECKSNCALQIAETKGNNVAEMLTNELIALKETIGEQEQLKLQREERIAALESQILELKEENVSYCGLQDQMKERLNAIQVENDELSRQVAECKSNCALQIAEAKGNNVAEILTNELMALKETIEQQEQLKLQREERIAALESQILELKEENLNYCGLQGQMKERLSAIQAENEELSRQVTECKSNCALEIDQVKSSSEAELMTLKETIEEHEQLKGQREERIAALQSKILELKEENLSYCGLQDQMKEKLSAIQGEKEELSQQVAECKSNCALQIAEAKGSIVAEMLRLNEEIAAKERQLREQISQAKTPSEQPVNTKYTDKLKQDIKKCWDDMKKMETEIAQLKTCIQQKDALLNSKEAESLQVKPSSLKSDVINSEEVEVLKRELNESQTKLMEAENGLKAVSAELKQKLAEITDLSASLEKATTNTKRPRTNRGTETPVEWSPDALEEYIRKLKLEDKKLKFNYNRIVKDLEAKFEKEKKQFASEGITKSEEIEKLNKLLQENEKAQQAAKAVGVDSEIQCDLMQNLLARAIRGEKGLLQLPDKFPDIGRLISEHKQQCQRIVQLEGQCNRCTCGEKNSKFIGYKLNHKSQDPQKSDSVDGDSTSDKKVGAMKAPYSLRSRDKTGKVLAAGLGIMSVKTNTAMKTKAPSSFPSKFSCLPGLSSASETRSKTLLARGESLHSLKRPCPAERNDKAGSTPSPTTESHPVQNKNSQPDCGNNGSKILAELDNVPSVAEKIQQFNRREKEISHVNEKDTPCKKKRVDRVDLVTPTKQTSNQAPVSPLITYEELLSLGPPTPDNKNSASNASSSKKNSNQEIVFRSLKDMSDTEINTDDLFEELMNL